MPTGTLINEVRQPAVQWRDNVHPLSLSVLNFNELTHGCGAVLGNVGYIR